MSCFWGLHGTRRDSRDWVGTFGSKLNANCCFFVGGFLSQLPLRRPKQPATRPYIHKNRTPATDESKRLRPKKMAHLVFEGLKADFDEIGTTTCCLRNCWALWTLQEVATARRTIHLGRTEAQVTQWLTVELYSMKLLPYSGASWFHHVINGRPVCKTAFFLLRRN